jgi:chaperonin GroES
VSAARKATAGGRKAAGTTSRGPARASGPGASIPQTKGETRMPKIRPLRDRIMVRRIEEKEKQVGGIIIPDSAKEKPQQAEVMAVGNGRILDNGTQVPLTVKKGDKVLIGKWSGTDIKIDGEEFLILKEDEVLGILD